MRRPIVVTGWYDRTSSMIVARPRFGSDSDLDLLSNSMWVWLHKWTTVYSTYVGRLASALNVLCRQSSETLALSTSKYQPVSIRPSSYKRAFTRFFVVLKMLKIYFIKVQLIYRCLKQALMVKKYTNWYLPQVTMKVQVIFKT